MISDDEGGATAGAVTIVIPTYDDEPAHLDQAIRSALDQTYPAVEVVVVDDGSTRPDTVEYLASMTGIRLIRQVNSGPGAARNAGIEAARGDFVLPLDADDWIEPNVVGLLVEAVAHPDVVAAFPSVHRFGAAEGAQDAPRVVRIGDIAVQNRVAATALYRRSVWADVGAYREADIVDEDWFMWLKVLGHTHATMVQVPGAVLHYRLRPGSRSNSRSAAPGTVQKAIGTDRPDLAAELYVAASLEAQALHREVSELRSFYRAWAPRVAPILRVRDWLQRLTGT